MRQPTPMYDMLLQLLGSLIKLLFVSMFTCTVLVVLAGIFGAGEAALLIYQIIWAFFWRICISLLGIIAVVTMLDGL